MLKIIQTPDQNLSLIQDNVDTELTKLQGSPMFPGSLVENVTLTSGQDNLVRHALGHSARFFVVLKTQVNTTIWAPNTASLNNNFTNETYINLRCSTTCVASVWVN